MNATETQKTSIKQLFDDMPISIRQLALKLGLNEVTLARVRDGEPTSKPTANKLLVYFSEVFGDRYTLRNVSGITITERNQNRKKTQ
jgi:hypothetical protein